MYNLTPKLQRNLIVFRYVVLVSLSLFVVIGQVCGQEDSTQKKANAPSTEVGIQKAAAPNFFQRFKSYGIEVWVGLIALGYLFYKALTIRSAIRKEIDAVIKKESEEYINEYFSTKLVAKPEILKDFLQEYQELRDWMLEQRLFIIFQKETPQQELVAYLKDKGFKHPLNNGYTIDDTLSDIKTGDLIIFANADENLNDTEIDEFAKKHRNKALFFYYGTRFNGNTPMKNFANSKSTLINRLKDLR